MSEEMARGTKRLLALALALGLAEDALDEEVHALAQELTLGLLNATDDPAGQEAVIAGSERLAAEVNNGGLDAQLAFLLGHNAPQEVEALLRRRAAGGDA
jgi:hypothetical protein